MELKYTSKDTEKLIDVFGSIAEKENNPEELFKEMLKLTDYPVPVLLGFLNCMTVLENKNQDFLKENYVGIIGYITLRLNYIKEKVLFLLDKHSYNKYLLSFKPLKLEKWFTKEELEFIIYLKHYRNEVPNM